MNEWDRTYEVAYWMEDLIQETRVLGAFDVPEETPPWIIKQALEQERVFIYTHEPELRSLLLDLPYYILDEDKYLIMCIKNMLDGVSL